jgi:hypothetical protein
LLFEGICLPQDTYRQACGRLVDEEVYGAGTSNQQFLSGMDGGGRFETVEPEEFLDVFPLSPLPPSIAFFKGRCTVFGKIFLPTSARF